MTSNRAVSCQVRPTQLLALKSQIYFYQRLESDTWQQVRAQASNASPSLCTGTVSFWSSKWATDCAPTVYFRACRTVAQKMCKILCFLRQNCKQNWLPNAPSVGCKRRRRTKNTVCMVWYCILWYGIVCIVLYKVRRSCRWLRMGPQKSHWRLELNPI